ncbi:hypothetical protein ACERII_13050 [Evansella sp. AB-rgal1]|uniref:hypothetical protein n=1 Tax=Evansella sp. AB-rgal1 TaxID=3242696 RepID=UPI00359DC119
MLFFDNDITIILGIMLVILLTFFLSRFFQGKIALSISFAIVLLLISFSFYLDYKSKFITFDEFASEQLDERKLWRMTIWTYDISSDFPEPKSHATTFDEEIIQKVLDDFSGMELKFNDDMRREYEKEYCIEITSHNSFSFYVDDHYLNQYEILTDTNHLQTIRSLVEGDELNWEEFD